MRPFLLVFLLLIATAGLARTTDHGCCRRECMTDSMMLSRPVTSTYSLEIGGTGLRETYLSPMRYEGLTLAAAGNWQKAMPFAPRMALMDFDARVAMFPRLVNPGGNALMQGFELEFFWGLGVYYALPCNFTVSIEGGPQLLGGTAILLRNSNNPVGVNLSATIAGKGQISWKGRIGNLPVSAALSARIPLAGTFFMPGYGETFFEILVGNHAGLVHPAWPGNHFRINALCSFRMDFGRTALEVGYRMIAERTHSNNLTNSQFSGCLSIGVIPHGLGRKNRQSEIRPHE
ncbi:MAG: DUF3316 domain-containing protein [Muribaculaceae bacterium]|nr:DUF3316 domain-containing protein [Muribaculaceae bacterium]